MESGSKPVITPTYLTKIQLAKIADNVNIYVELTALQNL
jgi:hypothetical protein